MTMQATRTTGKKRRSLPTKEQLRAWRDYIETAEDLRSRLGARLQDESSLSLGDYRVLLALSEAEGRRLRSSELADRVGWERSRLSHHLGRMERRGLVRREACTQDNRSAFAVLTDEGFQAFRAGSVPHLQAVHELFVEALSPEQLDTLHELTSTLRSHLEATERR